MSLADREKLAILRAKGKTIREVAKLMGFSHSTLSRELRRYGKFEYSPCHSDFHSKYRRKRVGRKRKIWGNESLMSCVDEKLRLGWSPEIISGWLKLQKDMLISHETIYQYVYQSGIMLVGYLPRRHVKRVPKSTYRKPKRSLIPNRLSIANRESAVNNREIFGHWESDSVVSGHNTAGLNVMVERQSRYVMINPVANGTAQETSQAIINQLAPLPQIARQSITYDNGCENTRHEYINAQIGTRSYFCNPYHSWEKGSVEQTNGLIRRFIPKKTDLSKVSLDQVKRIEYLLNTRPRKCLGYKTPMEVFNSNLALVQ